MKFLYVFPGRSVPPVTELLTAEALSAQAAAAERAGFAAVGLDEHPAPQQAWRLSPSGHPSPGAGRRRGASSSAKVPHRAGGAFVAIVVMMVMALFVNGVVVLAESRLLAWKERGR